MKIYKNRDFVVVGQQSFDSKIGSNCIDIAKEISKNNRVLYINFPLDMSTYLRKPEGSADLIKNRKAVLNGKDKPLKQISANLWTYDPKTVLFSINGLPKGAIFNHLLKVNNKWMAKYIRKATTELNFENYIIFNDSDMFRSFYLKEILKPAGYIYYTRDNLVAHPFFVKHGKDVEAKLMAKSDLVVSNSLYLRDCGLKYNNHSYYIGQGCEIEMFNPNTDYNRPDDLPSSERPIIGYVGALLNDRLDIPLLEKLAAKNPQWNFVFVGPEDEAFSKSSLHDLENVTFTGSKKPTEIPTYINFFDVAMNPQGMNPLTIGNYPRKIDEYLAMGKPCVATKTRAMKIFEDHVHLADNLEDYENLIKLAIDEVPNKNLALERIKFAKTHTWEASVNELYNAMEKLNL